MPHRRHHISRALAGALAAAALACCLGGCSGSAQDTARLSQAAGVSVPAGRLVVDEGAHARGKAECAAYELVLGQAAASELESALEGSDEWQRLPASEALAHALWGADGTGVGAITPADGEDFLPRPQEGWVLFRDELAAAGAPKDADSQLAGAFSHGRASVTVGIYDAGARTLYLYEIDS